MTRTIAPHGTWRSPITPALLVEQAVRLSTVEVAGDWVYWVESRPAEAGREVIVRTRPGSEPEDVVPDGFSARTQVHEYGGRCYAIHGDTVVFSNWADQRLYTVSPGEGSPRPLTPEPDSSRGDRFADPVITADGSWLICVHEHHDADGTVDNNLVVVALDPPDPTRAPRVVASGHDFYGSPRLSPDGTRLAWVTWDHPHMPWDTTELWVAEDRIRSRDRRGPAGRGRRRRVGHPAPVGTLGGAALRVGPQWLVEPLRRARRRRCAPSTAEFAEPDWTFGNASYGFRARWDAGRHVGGRVAASSIGVVSEGRTSATAFPFSRFDSVNAGRSGGVRHRRLPHRCASGGAPRARDGARSPSCAGAGR